jgi:hypothetical protein
MLDDDLLIEAREAFEYKMGRWKRGSLKYVIENGLQLFIQKNLLPKRRKR